MRRTLQSVTEELTRLKRAGIRTVSIAPDSLLRLQAAVKNYVASHKTKPLEQMVDPKSQSRENRENLAGSSSVGNSARLFPDPPKITLPDGEKALRWEFLRDLVLRDETCRKHVGANKQVVFGVGNINAGIMFVGEAPGAEEEMQGEPFVGPAGILLTKMIAAMGLTREDVYIGNIMNWRPQMQLNASGEQIGNRPPTDEEMNYCLPYLRAQIEVIDPQVVVALGATAARGLLANQAFGTLGEVRGKWHEFEHKPLMITYHPSYILRSQSNRSKRLIWEDLLQVMDRSGLPISDKQRGYFLGG
ncbi:MAG: uracil-DNA glycosylase [Cephaloticoccus sp.]|nr:uracil-DNA glycosylase [Cephaloticoccus sp.]MCF7760017.1 uracil-DNA glycosylase [Cephaloticoccus sp.]